MFETFQLPDGTMAESSSDVDRYLKESGMALASDYSAEYLNRIQQKKEKGQREDIFLDFVQQYKKRIWNE